MKITPAKSFSISKKASPRQKRKRNTAKDFSGGRTAGTEWRRKEARIESPRDRSVRRSLKPPRARRVRSQTLRDTKYVRISSYRRSQSEARGRISVACGDWERKILTDFPMPVAIGDDNFASCSDWLRTLNRFRNLDWICIKREVGKFDFV